MELEYIAEGGNTSPLSTSLEGNTTIRDIVQTGDLIGPGASATYTVDVRFSASSDKRFNQVRMASMLIPTDDTFIALNGVTVSHDEPTVLFLRAYDAGSEANDEACANIPGGGPCGGGGWL